MKLSKQYVLTGEYQEFVITLTKENVYKVSCFNPEMYGFNEKIVIGRLIDIGMGDEAFDACNGPHIVLDISDKYKSETVIIKISNIEDIVKID